MPKLKLNKSNIEKLSSDLDKQTLYCDTELKGFILCVGKNTKTYFAQGLLNKRTIRVKIGRHGLISAERAREIAREKLFEISQGKDPRRSDDDENQKEITLSQALEDYITRSTNLGARTKSDYQYNLTKYIPDWLTRDLRSITKHDIAARHAKITKDRGPVVANYTMRVVRAIFNFSIATYDLECPNPVNYLSQIKAWNPQPRRRTCLSRYQLPKWLAAISDLDNCLYRDFFLVVLFTGMRKTEAATLEWANINFEERTLTVPNTKNHDPLVLPLSDFLYKLLRQRHKMVGTDCRWVFPSPSEEGFFKEPKKGHYKIQRQTGIKISTHDLRRTFITLAESLDISYFSLKNLINHRTSNDITGGYICMDVERLRVPVQKISEQILSFYPQLLEKVITETGMS